MAKKRQPDPAPDEGPKSDFEGKPPPVAPKDAPPTLPRVYPWRGWTIAEWETKRAGERGHLLFRRSERALAFIDLIRKGLDRVAFKLALGRMRPDWKTVEEDVERKGD